MSKLVKVKYKRQVKKNFFLSFLKNSKEFILSKKWEMVLLNFAMYETLFVHSGWKWYIPLIGCYPLTMCQWSLVKWFEICKCDKKIEDFNIIDNVNGVLRIWTEHSNLDENKIEIQINSTISKIVQDIEYKNIFYIYHKRGKVDDYRKIDKGSLERLTQVLFDLKYSPVYENTTENEIEISHQYTLICNIKQLERQQKNIEHKLGVEKGSLEIDQNKGLVSFRIKKDTTKIYILDEVLPYTKRPEMTLPFIAGCDVKTGNVITKDLVELNHILIAGKSKMGKSSTFKSVIETLMYYNQNIAFYMLDFGESALVRYENFANCKYIESDRDKVEECISELITEMHRRRKLFRENKVEKLSEYDFEAFGGSQLPYLILTVDEANGFKTILDLKKEEKLVKDISTLYFQGRKYGIYIIMAVQQTSDTYYFKPWKTQSTRFIHYLADPIDVTNASANSELQKIIPYLKTGEFILDCEGDFEKLKGVLTDNENNKLYEILKNVYGRDKKVSLSKEKDEVRHDSPNRNTANH